MAYILRKAPRRNMRLTAFQAVRKQSLMKLPINLISRARKGVQATRNISKAKEHFEQRKAGSEHPKAGVGQHSPNAEQHGAAMEQRKADLPKKQAREKAADRVRRRSLDTARQSVKAADREVQTIKTVERGEKIIKQSADPPEKLRSRPRRNPLRLLSRRPERPSRPVRPRQRWREIRPGSGKGFPPGGSGGPCSESSRNRYQGGGKSYCCGSKGNYRGNQSTGCRDCCRWLGCCCYHRHYLPDRADRWFLLSFLLR